MALYVALHMALYVALHMALYVALHMALYVHIWVQDTISGRKVYSNVARA